MADSIFALLQRITDPILRDALKTLAQRLTTVQADVATLDATALKQGSPVDAYAQRIRHVADPVREQDAVTLGFLRRHVAGALAVSKPAPAALTVDAGGAKNPGPEGTFVADTYSLPAGGGPVILTWTSKYATEAYISYVGAVGLNGSIPVNPTQSTTGSLTLTGPGGVTTYTITITVAASPAPPAAPTGTFQASPPQIAPGQPTQLVWTSSGAATATITPTLGVVLPTAGGNATVTPTVTTTYTLQLDGAGGRTTIQVVVTVGSNPNPPPPPPPPPPPTTSYSAGTLTWGFANGGVRFPWKGWTAFSLYHDALDPSRISRSLAMTEYFASGGATVPRVFLTIAGNPFGPDIRLYPTERSNFYSSLPGFVTALNARGQMPELVLFGAFVEIWGTDGVAFEAMKEYVRQVARTLLPYRGAFIQIANEWNQIGFTNAGQIVALANEYRAIDPTRPLTLSAPNGPGDADTSMQVVPPATYHTVHISRVQTPTRAQWIIRHFGNPTIMNGVVPAVSDEPINAGYRSDGGLDVEPDPQYWYAFARMGQIMGWSGTFHYDGGLYNQAPFLGTAEDLCFRAWILGQVPPTADEGTIFAATPAGVAFGPCPWANSGSNPGLIGRTFAGGTAYALVFGTGGLPAVSAGWGTVLTDAMTTGGIGRPYGLGSAPWSQIRGYTVLPAGF